MRLHFAVTVGLLGGTAVLAALSTRRIPEALQSPLEAIDSQISGWTAVKDQTLGPSVLKALNPTSYLSRRYQKKSSDLDLFVAFYAQQRAGESMHSPKHCLPGGGWDIWKHDSMLVPLDGQQIRVNKYSIQNQGARMLMVYWYQSKDRIVANEYFGKLLLARDTVLTGHTAGSIVRIVLADVPGADQDGAAFASKLIPQVQRCFGSSGPLRSE